MNFLTLPASIQPVMVQKKDNNPKKGKKKTGVQPVEEGTAKKADLKKNHYPLPEEKDVQYNNQPEFIDSSGKKKKG